MAEKAVEAEVCAKGREDDQSHETVQNEEENDESVRTLMAPDEAYLLELNLVMIIASLALPDQDFSEVEDDKKINVKEQDFKTIVSKLRGTKREFDELKIPDRRATRLQPKILDSRHGRKM